MSAPEPEPDGWVVYGPDGEKVAAGPAVTVEAVSAAGEETG